MGQLTVQVAVVVAIVTRVITAHRVYRTPKSTMPPQTDLGGQLHQRNTLWVSR
ncbi:hypothetical protein L227DRAFT_577112 [Lentinus tigrinus ALCF2SS1-6]|uniref:Uncharacterized protein n=1 Tax=Lentinus tigrinus ALCF2SS1-6 TaxID=1328759 RepID=A0A5C2S5V3_9APHY|nr:hypothetical protein L227DRAFT_577112 [Lentinus tigrinus ALCF2SS1-6]